MDGRHELDTGIRYAGQQQIQTLAFATLHALERAGLRDVVDELKRRVLDRDWQEVCDILQAVDSDTQQISYKPMIELLLYEVKHVARAPHVSDDDRRIRIEWAMTLAGV
jgi:hypothetical protein